jgi:phosphate-selective porin OprO/OprP
MKVSKIFMILMFATFLAAQSTFGDTKADTQTKGELDWSDGILSFRTADKQFGLRFDVRGYVDYGMFFEEKDLLSDAWNFRRARFALKAQLWKDWYVEYDMDIGGNKVEIKDLYVMKKFSRNFGLKVGNFKPAYSLEEVTTSRFISFLERAYINEFTPGRRPGIGSTYYSDHFFVSATAFGQSYESHLLSNENLKKKDKFDETWGFSGRFVYFPLNEDGKVLHLGVSLLSEEVDSDFLVKIGESVKYDLRSEQKISNTKFLSTGDILNVERQNFYTAEFAGAYKQFSFQSEYLMAKTYRTSGLQYLDFSGFYVFASYFPFGGERHYKSSEAEFDQITFYDINESALELLYRYSFIDLEDKDILGGIAANHTFGMSYYFNKNVKWLINYTLVDNNKNATRTGKFEGNYDFSYIQTRLLFFF